MAQKYVSYYRVSTAKQGRSGLGLEAQRASVQAFVASVGGDLDQEFREIESGKLNDRPQLLKALKACRLKGAVLLVARLDRLSRNAAFLTALQESSVRFVCCDMPEANEMTVGLMAILAQQERKLISERTKAALTAAKARGMKLGGVRAGHDIAVYGDKGRATSAAVRTEAARARARDLGEVIADMREEIGADASLRVLAARLNDAGYVSPRGGKLTAATVQRALRVA